MFKWWVNHQPDEHALALAREAVSRPEVMAEIERLNATPAHDPLRTALTMLLGAVREAQSALKPFADASRWLGTTPVGKSPSAVVQFAPITYGDLAATVHAEGALAAAEQAARQSLEVK